MNFDYELIEKIRAAAIIVASNISETVFNIDDDKVIYRIYRENINKYYTDMRNNVLFNNQKIGEEKSLVEEKREKELFMTYLFWPNDEEFLNVQMNHAPILERMLEGVNIRANYLKQYKNNQDYSKNSLAQEKVEVSPKPEDELMDLAHSAVASYQSMKKHNNDLETLLEEKEHKILELQEIESQYNKLQKEYQKVLDESETVRISTNKYIDELLDQIHSLQEENSQLASKAQKYDEIIPSIKTALESINNPNVDFKENIPQR